MPKSIDRKQIHDIFAWKNQVISRNLDKIGFSLSILISESALTIGIPCMKSSACFHYYSPVSSLLFQGICKPLDVSSKQTHKSNMYQTKYSKSVYESIEHKVFIYIYIYMYIDVYVFNQQCYCILSKSIDKYKTSIPASFEKQNVFIKQTQRTQLPQCQDLSI